MVGAVPADKVSRQLGMKITATLGFVLLGGIMAIARAAFTHGMDVALVVAALIACVGALLAAIFLPSHATPDEAEAHRGRDHTESASRPRPGNVSHSPASGSRLL